MDIPPSRIGSLGLETVPRSAAAISRNGLRVGDFAYRDDHIFLRKTGNSAPFDRRLVAEVTTWPVIMRSFGREP